MVFERRVTPIKSTVLVLLVTVGLVSCSDDRSGGPQQPKADIAAGKTVAERDCKGCHGLDGKGAAPGVPNLAGQLERYLVESLQEYKDRKRMHGALRDIAGHLNETEARNVAAFFAGLPPIAATAGTVFSPYDHGKALVPACTKCHGENGNSKTPGMPTLAGQEPHYFFTAAQEYLNGARETSPMHALIRGLNKVDLDSIALFFASQTPTPRNAPPFGDPATGEKLTTLCAGCHGIDGVSSDSVTPSLASQDPDYLVSSTKAYRNKRRHEQMQRAIAALSDKDIENISAYYTVQKSKPAENGQLIVRELTEKCNRCHGAESGGNAAVLAFPRINGQDRDYLTMALRAYRDGRRQSSVMHNMSIPYGDAIIESLATFYATQAAKPSK